MPRILTCFIQVASLQKVNLKIYTIDQVSISKESLAQAFTVDKFLKISLIFHLSLNVGLFTLTLKLIQVVDISVSRSDRLYLSYFQFLILA